MLIKVIPIPPGVAAENAQLLDAPDIQQIQGNMGNVGAQQNAEIQPEGFPQVQIPIQVFIANDRMLM